MGEGLLIREDSEPIWLVKAGVGASAASMAVENLIALGIDKFISIGTAGTFQNKIDIGDIVVCEKALRDEGVSYHYLPPSRYTEPSEVMNENMIDVLEDEGYDHHLGPTWTIDAVFRETEKEIETYREEGIYTVDMEAAALFAVGDHRDVEITSLFTISDRLTGDE
ncbi:MAG: nucleoside phosphorylase [Candidatus Natronoplasma sp.]